MAGKPYIIRVSSQKGGVGKSTFAISFADALRTLGNRVLLVDADFINPSLGTYLGMEDVNIGFREVTLGKADIRKAIIPHAATGLHVLPGTIDPSEFRPTGRQVENVSKLLKEMSYDFIIIDTQPGVMNSDALRPEFYSEIIIVTTPELVSTISAVKLSKLCERQKLKNNLVLNRCRNKSYEISEEEIEEMYENKALGSLPEDDSVPVSIAQHIPAFSYHQASRFSRGIANIARVYSGRSGVLLGTIPKVRAGLIERISEAIKDLLGMQ